MFEDVEIWIPLNSHIWEIIVCWFLLVQAQVESNFLAAAAEVPTEKGKAMVFQLENKLKKYEKNNKKHGFNMLQTWFIDIYWRCLGILSSKAGIRSRTNDVWTVWLVVWVAFVSGRKKRDSRGYTASVASACFSVTDIP